MTELPTGLVTFLFTDIEGSTALLKDLGPAGYANALAEHRRILRNTFERHQGVEVDTQGDAFFVAFSDATDAVAAADDAQRALTGGPIHVRMGLHTGRPHVSSEGYVGEDVHLGARIAAAGHGGQVLLSKATRVLVDHEAFDLGEHRLKDLAGPVWIYQLGADHFPPLKTISNTNLPRPASSFVGREREVAEITALLSDSARLVTLTGPGGTGKTRLAIESAAGLVPEFRNGVFWIGLATLRDSSLVLDSIAQTLGAKDGLSGHIGERQMLLLLDNLEQVVEAAPELAALVEECPNLRLLATSRERLRVRGEREFAVPPLATPEAIELFAARAQRAADDAVAELCRRLDNLPLAVELAAARTSVLSPAQIVDRLSQRLDLLKGGRDADPRQQTLRATIEWSHELLDTPERDLFARLAVFAGGCTLEAAEEVIGATVDTLQSLVEKSLVRHGDERFWMLETIREFATERLHASGAADALRVRHAEHFLALAEEAEPNLLGSSSESWLDLLERDHENLRSALDQFESSGDFESAMRFAGAIAEFWDQRGHHVEGLRDYRTLLEVETAPTLARAKVLSGASMLASKSDDRETAVRWGKEALALHRRFGDEHGAAVDLWGLAYLRIEDGDYAMGQEMLRESIDLLTEVGDDASTAWATRTLAYSYFASGDHERARSHYEEMLRRAREIGDPRLQAHGLGTLAEYAIDGGRSLEAAILARQTLEIAASAGDPLLVTARLCGVARVLDSLSRPNAAVRLISHAESRYLEIGAKESWVATGNQKTLARIRETLGQAAFDDEWEQGRKLSPEAAMALAFAEIDDAIERNRRS